MGSKKVFSIISLVICLSSCGSTDKREQSYLDSANDVPNDRRAEFDRPKGNVVPFKSSYDETLALLTLSPLFNEVSSASLRKIAREDSLEQVRGTLELLPQDTLIISPVESEAYNAILLYKRTVETMRSKETQCAYLDDLKRTADGESDARATLPEVSSSKFHGHDPFFFLGGGAFFYQTEEDLTSTYRDDNGNIEMHFTNAVTENVNYLLSSVVNCVKPEVKVSFGGPLDSYDSGPQDVRGIGSLIHEFPDRVPVILFTKSGLIDGSLLSITVKLVDENLGCVSDRPSVKIACPARFNPEEILAAYIPYDSRPKSLTVRYIDANVWTADMDGDNVPEFACVRRNFTGITDDTLVESFWFVNIDGKWEFIDAGAELDCT